VLVERVVITVVETVVANCLIHVQAGVNRLDSVAGEDAGVEWTRVEQRRVGKIQGSVSEGDVRDILSGSFCIGGGSHRGGLVVRVR
jgi:hypothetical protein